MAIKSDLKEFWSTIDFLLAVEARKSKDELRAEADDWADKFIGKSRSRFLIESIDAPTSFILGDFNDNVCNYGSIDREIKKFVAKLDLPPIECKFSHPQIRSKLEKLMGSNLVSLTDRSYMIYLQERILLDYSCCMNKRIAIRQAEEMERVKNLVLNGKIPLSQAPPEMASHPVMLIDELCKRELAERRAKIKMLKPNIPKYIYWDDTPDPPSGLSIELGHVLRKGNDLLCIPPETLLATEESENIADGLQFTDEEFSKIKYESPLINQLKECETVEEMYELADSILGTTVVKEIETVEEEETNEEN